MDCCVRMESSNKEKKLLTLSVNWKIKGKNRSEVGLKVILETFIQT